MIQHNGPTHAMSFGECRPFSHPLQPAHRIRILRHRDAITNKPFYDVLLHGNDAHPMREVLVSRKPRGNGALNDGPGRVPLRHRHLVSLCRQYFCTYTEGRAIPGVTGHQRRPTFVHRELACRTRMDIMEPAARL